MAGSSFTPPSPEQVRHHLARCSPEQPSRWIAMLPMLVLVAVVVLTLTIKGVVMVFLPAAVLIALVLVMNYRVGSLKRTEQTATQAQELAARREYSWALRTAWRVLPQVRFMHELHGRTVAVMAHCLDQVKAYDSAIVAYDFLLDHLPREHPGAVQVAVQRAMTQLLTDQLTDADDALRRLRSLMPEYQNTPIFAAYRLAGLLQQVRTYHFADAVAQQGDLISDLKPLGVDAGHGYALMALSHHMVGGDQTQLWWSHATTLLTPAVLIGRFDQLKPIHDLPPTPVPAELSVTR